MPQKVLRHTEDKKYKTSPAGSFLIPAGDVFIMFLLCFGVFISKRSH